MGNRAVISITDSNEIPTANKESTPSIYLHWNGGKDSIDSFLYIARCAIGPSDVSYGVARLSQIIGNWLGGTLSLGIGTYGWLDTDNYDNGVYWVNAKTWQIVGREFQRRPEQQAYDSRDLANDVYLKQPEEIRERIDSNTLAWDATI